MHYIDRAGMPAAEGRLMRWLCVLGAGALYGGGIFALWRSLAAF